MSMRIKIKKSPGAFTNEAGLLVAPKKDEEVSVNDTMGRTFVAAGLAEEVSEKAETAAESPPKSGGSAKRRGKRSAAPSETTGGAGPKEKR
jgi:hypothetical protein